MQKNNTKILATSAMMVALSFMLSIFPKFSGLWPNGGSITVCSMLPIIMVSYIYGYKWGFLASTAFALLQLLTGLKGIAGMDLMTTFLVVLLDYIIAFVVLGFGGMFHGKFNNPAKELCLGSIVAIGLRFLSHFLSGYFLFSSYAEWFFTQEGFTLGNQIFESLGNGTALYIVYSLMYNGSYLIPEMVITGIVAYIIGKKGIIERLSK